MKNKGINFKTLIIVPARGGSKSIPKKNLADIGGKPLIEFTLRAAVEANLPGKVCLSTNDIEIRNTGIRIPGVEAPFLRPSRLARDDSPTVSAVLHALLWYEKNEKFSPQFIILLQPTCPFRSTKTIINAYDSIIKSKADSLISVNLVREHPCEYVLPKKNGFCYVMQPPAVPRRQNFPKVYFINGAIFIVRVPYFKKTGQIYDMNSLLFEMPSEESLDINDPQDLEYANWLYKKCRRGIKRGS